MNFKVNTKYCITPAVIALIGMGLVSAHASPFTFDWGETTDKLYFNGDTGVTSSYGSVPDNSSDHDVSITTDVAADFSNGFATVKPSANGGVIKSLTFKPLTPNTLDAFSFRGQLKSAQGSPVYTVLVSVLDNNSTTYSNTYTYDNSAQTDLFKANQDFKSLRVFSNTTGEWIQSVTVSTQYGFKEEKQNKFNLYDPNHPGGGGGGGASIPEPAFIQLSSLLILGGLGLRFRRR